MTRFKLAIAAAIAANLCASPVLAQSGKGVERLYVLDCGQGRRRRHFALVAGRQCRSADRHSSTAAI